MSTKHDAQVTGGLRKVGEEQQHAPMRTTLGDFTVVAFNPPPQVSPEVSSKARQYGGVSDPGPNNPIRYRYIAA